MSRQILPYGGCQFVPKVSFYFQPFVSSFLISSVGNSTKALFIFSNSICFCTKSWSTVDLYPFNSLSTTNNCLSCSDKNLGLADPKGKAAIADITRINPPLDGIALA